MGYLSVPQNTETNWRVKIDLIENKVVSHAEIEDMPRHHYRNIPPRNDRIEQGLDVFLAMHAKLFALINVLGNFVQGKYQSSKGSTPGEQDRILLAVIVVLLIYVLLLLQELNFRIQNSIYSEILGKCSLLGGFLATILLVLMLVPSLGWMLLVIWATFFVKAFLDSLKEACRLLCGAALQALGLLRVLLMGRRLIDERARLPV